MKEPTRKRLGEPQTVPFPSSQMGRQLLSVTVQLVGANAGPLLLATAHLESTKDVLQNWLVDVGGLKHVFSIRNLGWYKKLTIDKFNSGLVNHQKLCLVYRSLYKSLQKVIICQFWRIMPPSESASSFSPCDFWKPRWPAREEPVLLSWEGTWTFGMTRSERSFKEFGVIWSGTRVECAMNDLSDVFYLWLFMSIFRFINIYLLSLFVCVFFGVYATGPFSGEGCAQGPGSRRWGPGRCLDLLWVGHRALDLGHHAEQQRGGQLCL